MSAFSLPISNLTQKQSHLILPPLQPLSCPCSPHLKQHNLAVSVSGHESWSFSNLFSSLFILFPHCLSVSHLRCSIILTPNISFLSILAVLLFSLLINTPHFQQYCLILLFRPGIQVCFSQLSACCSATPPPPKQLAIPLFPLTFNNTIWSSLSRLMNPGKFLANSTTSCVTSIVISAICLYICSVTSLGLPMSLICTSCNINLLFRKKALLTLL